MNYIVQSFFKSDINNQLHSIRDQYWSRKNVDLNEVLK